MIALRRVGHLNLAGQDGLVGMASVQPEVMPPRSALDVFLYDRPVEWQIRPAIQKLVNPSDDFRDEGAFVNWHGLEPEC